MSAIPSDDPLDLADQTPYVENVYTSNAAAQNDEYEAVPNHGGSNQESGLFSHDNQALMWSNFADQGQYIEIDPDSKKVVCKIGGLITKEMLEGDDAPFITAGNEKNITNDVNPDSRRQLYTLPLGVGWPSGTRSTLFFVKNTIVEFHSPDKQRNLKVRGDNDRGIPYEHYMRAGVPAIVKQWIKMSAAQGVGLVLTDGPRESMDTPAVGSDGQPDISDCYAWFTANVPTNHVPQIKLKLKGAAVQTFTERGSLKSLMEKFKCGVVGNAVFKITAKRPENYDGVGVQRTIGFNLMSFEILSLTKRQSQSPDTFKGFDASGQDASDEITRILRDSAKAGPVGPPGPSQAAARIMQQNRKPMGAPGAGASAASTAARGPGQGARGY